MKVSFNKKSLALVLAVTLSLSALTACGSQTETTTAATTVATTEAATTEAPTTEAPTTEAASGEATWAGQLTARVEEELLKASGTIDLEAIANTIASDETLTPFSAMVMTVAPGYLNGFEGEVTGFDKGVIMSPMIGSIPYVSYFFETQDAAALADTLTAQADLRWNICTEADEMAVKVVGNYVYVVLCPFSSTDF